MNRLYTIQYARALAALVVVIFHGFVRVQDEFSAAAGDLFRLGHAGVDIFFVISGFIIFSIGERTSVGPVEFIRRRLIRVAPLYWIATLGWAAFVLVFATYVVVEFEPVILSLLFVPHYNETFPDRIYPILVPGWTLNYEMFFYLLFALVMVWRGAIRLAALLTAILALVVVGFVVSPVNAVAATYTDPLLLEFAAGCVIGAVWSRWRLPAAAAAAILVVGAALLIALAPYADAQDHQNRVLTFGVPAVLIIAGAAYLSDRVPRWRTAETLGDASYSIYLFHLFAVVPLHAVWVRLGVGEGSLAGLVFVAICVVVSAVFGVFVHRQIELPLYSMMAGRPLVSTASPR